MSNFFKTNLGDLTAQLCAHTFALVTQDICQRVCDAAEPCPMKRERERRSEEERERENGKGDLKTKASGQSCVKISCRRLAVSTEACLSLSLSSCWHLRIEPYSLRVSAISSGAWLGESVCVCGRMEWENTWLTPAGSLPFSSLFLFWEKMLREKASEVDVLRVGWLANFGRLVIKS